MQHTDDVDSFAHNGYTVRIIRDVDPLNPREEYDPASTMVCFHPRYDLGDKHDFKDDDYSGWGEVLEAIKERYRPVVALPLYLIDHSGISIRAGRDFVECDPQGWDSGQVGFAFVSREVALREWGAKRVTRKVRDLAKKCLLCEIETYDQFLRGDVWGYVIETPDGETVDSCWGFFGYEYCKSEATACVSDEPALVGGESEDTRFEATLA